MIKKEAPNGFTYTDGQISSRPRGSQGSSGWRRLSPAQFWNSRSENLKGYRVALVTTHGPELPEFDVPLHYLRDQGASVDVVTQDWLFDWQPEAPGMVVLAQWLAVNVCVQADKKVPDTKIEDYDAVITIGGAWNPMRKLSNTFRLIFHRTDGKVITKP
jgi:hypothetical protein